MKPTRCFTIGHLSYCCVTLLCANVVLVILLCYNTASPHNYSESTGLRIKSLYFWGIQFVRGNQLLTSNNVFDLNPLRSRCLVCGLAVGQSGWWKIDVRLAKVPHFNFTYLRQLSIPFGDVIENQGDDISKDHIYRCPKWVLPFYKLTAHKLRSLGSKFPQSCLHVKGVRPFEILS